MHMSEVRRTTQLSTPVNSISEQKKTLEILTFILIIVKQITFEVNFYIA